MSGVWCTYPEDARHGESTSSESRVNGRVLVDKEGLAGNDPIQTENYVGPEPIRNDKAHSRIIDTVHSENSKENGRALETRPIENTRLRSKTTEAEIRDTSEAGLKKREAVLSPRRQRYEQEGMGSGGK